MIRLIEFLIQLHWFQHWTWLNFSIFVKFVAKLYHLTQSHIKCYRSLHLLYEFWRNFYLFIDPCSEIFSKGTRMNQNAFRKHSLPLQDRFRIVESQLQEFEYQQYHPCFFLQDGV